MVLELEGPDPALPHTEWAPLREFLAHAHVVTVELGPGGESPHFLSPPFLTLIRHIGA